MRWIRSPRTQSLRWEQQTTGRPDQFHVDSYPRLGAAAPPWVGIRDTARQGVGARHSLGTRQAPRANWPQTQPTPSTRTLRPGVIHSHRRSEQSSSSRHRAHAARQRACRHRLPTSDSAPNETSVTGTSARSGPTRQDRDTRDTQVACAREPDPSNRLAPPALRAMSLAASQRTPSYGSADTNLGLPG